MKKILVTLLLLCGTTLSMQAQQFEKYFEDRTLRLDYTFSGTHEKQQIYFHKATKTSQWAGRRSRLSEMFLRGNGQLQVRRHDGDHELLYVHTFSTLFQEWLATDEAKRTARSFEGSYHIPYPKEAVDITVTLTDFHHQVVAELTHTLDPKDVLIRQVDQAATPYSYVWKPTKEPDITDCIDLAIVAEGYTKEQMGKFQKDCQRAVDVLFSHEPFASLKNRFNVIGVNSISEEEGVSVPHEGIWKRTAVGCHYDMLYTQRYLMTQQMHHLYDLLDGIPFEHIIVLVNTERYGGGGIYNQINVSSSDHPTFRQVFVHEFGHGYAGLGDEYIGNDGYETMYPADTEPWEPNLTTLKDFDSKWRDMLPEGTLIPTPPVQLPDYRNLKNEEERRQLNEATQRLGVFEGGGYQTKGVYRPCQECRMKINEVEHFCPVCTRAIIRITDFYTSR